ncbi:hypothetical protein [uncultured Pediococcus sp.]|uniref:hypothetical protein n=1 Tax=uncultured Pediococcus sp. TaxID=165192 RepID=UPI00259B3341|nr:hypothetical protein [uncultured Pediococcus sp.]
MNKFTKRERDQLVLAYENYNKNRYGNIFGAYGRPSQKKVEIWQEIESLYKSPRVLSKNTNFFTAGAFMEDGEFILIKPSEDLKAPVELIKEWMI